MTKALDRSEAETEFENEQDKIFIEMPIPRTLSEIGFLQAEKDIREGKQGTGSTLYGIVTGMKSDMSGTGKQNYEKWRFHFIQMIFIFHENSTL